MPDEGYKIRPAGRRDAEAIAKLWSLMAEQHRNYDPDVWCWSVRAEQAWREGFLTRVDQEDVIMPVAEAPNGALLGFAQAVAVDSPPIFAAARQGEVWDLVVKPEARGRGIGRRLMEAVFQGLKARGAQEVKLHVAVDNAAAIRLYERLGMRRVMYRMQKTL